MMDVNSNRSGSDANAGTSSENRVKDEDRYAALVAMWIHQNSTQFQWPALILSAVFVAISLLVDKVTVTAMIDKTKWGCDPQLQYGAGVPMLLIGVGTLAMSYTMGRNRRVLGILEDELDKYRSANRSSLTFSRLVHPSGISGSKLIWWFLAFIALATLWLGIVFVSGVGRPAITAISLAAATLVWTLGIAGYIRHNYRRKTLQSNAE